MSRMRTFMTVVLPSMLAGGLLFQSTFGNAATGDNVLAFWPAASDATSPRRLPPPPPAPPAPPAPPRAPLPPRPGVGSGMSVRFDNGKVQIDGIKELVTQQLDSARAAMAGNKAIPKHVRDKVIARLDKARATVDKRLSNLDLSDLDNLEEEMEKMGEEIEEAMEGFEEEMEKFGEQMGKDIAEKMQKDFGKNFGKMNLHWDGNRGWRRSCDWVGPCPHDDDDADEDEDEENDVVMAPSVDIDVDDDDLKDALSDLKDLGLKPQQRDVINKLRSDSDRTVASARKQLDQLTDELRTALDNPSSSDAEVSRLIDQVSAQEAVIRKARIVAWVQARRVLDAGQQKRIQDAAGKRGK